MTNWQDISTAPKDGLRSVPIQMLFEHANAIYDHPSRSDVRPGCECGCGGDSMDDADWQHYDDAEKEAREFFAGLGINPVEWEEIARDQLAEQAQALAMGYDENPTDSIA